MGYARFMALIFLSLALFFSGCAQGQGGAQAPPAANPAPQPPANMPPVPGPMTNTSNATPQQQPPVQDSCAISVPKRNLSLGDEIFVFVNATASPSDPVTLSCPEGSLALGNGSMAKNVLCKFPNSGYFNLTASIGAAQCAILEVTVGAPLQNPAQPKSCSIQSYSREVSGEGYSADYTYKLTVNYTGYMAGDSMTWNCDNNIGTIVLPGLPGKQVSGTANIECTFHYRIYNPTIPVMINGDSCGEVSTRQP